MWGKKRKTLYKLPATSKYTLYCLNIQEVIASQPGNLQLVQKPGIIHHVVRTTNKGRFKQTNKNVCVAYAVMIQHRNS